MSSFPTWLFGLLEFGRCGMSPRTSEGITRVSRRRCAALANAPRQREPLSVRPRRLVVNHVVVVTRDAYPTIAQLAEPAESPRDMHWRRGTSIPGRAFARRNSSTNCPISHRPRPRRLIRGAVRDGGRPWSRIVAWIQPPCTPMVTWTGCASQDPYRMALVAACPVRSPRASPRRARPATTTLVLGSVYCNPLAHRGQSLHSGGVRGDRASSASHGPSTKWFVLSLTQSTSTSTPRHIRHPGRPHRTHLTWGRHNT